MSTHKHFDKICCVVLALTLILTLLFINAEHFGVQKASTVMGYEKTLFDTSKVHIIDIIMDEWDEFTANCKSEEYYTCTVVIDNEAYKNVAIRGKGNTSLSQVSNDRYSYKIEFDHYDSTNTYYGLDKLCLNNIIQDNTYMKDYLSYQMMNEMGVASPLCSYAYITVNGEDWGLYLAVEGVEESFLRRNYGKDYGELYKPDSMSMGGGRGNGEKFDMDELLGDSELDDSTGITDNQPPNNNYDGGFQHLPNRNTDGDINNQMPGGTQRGFRDQMPEGMTPPDGFELPDDIEIPDGMEMPDGMQGNMPGGMGGGGMMNNSDDVLLKYIDDNTESYSNIFDNAKTDITEFDKARLIEALRKLSNGEDLDNTVDIDTVIRYFVVHNFVVNFDSYTGSMIHNYYLYENDGQMQMIPWDYNLAFGGFQSMGSAISLVNYPIDSPVSGGDASDRPMLAWIFASEEYTELYHQYFAEFIATCFNSGCFSEMIDNVNAMISPYVEKDPTKFCTYDEFKTGISTLKEFCLLRAESISGQLDGTIGSTSDTQESDTLIDAGDMQINDMGSMGSTMGGDKDKFNSDIQKPQTDNNATEDNSSDDSNANDNNGSGNNGIPQMPGNFGGGQMQSQGQNTISDSSWIVIGVSVLVLALGLVLAFTFKRRK
ncbi:hypothetical protein IMSAG013_00973 [Clostridiales bacterium]|nr:hypothetical protein IMSAG013_00973 [Clostridiales bacterium]